MHKQNYKDVCGSRELDSVSEGIPASSSISSFKNHFSDAA